MEEKGKRVKGSGKNFIQIFATLKKGLVMHLKEVAEARGMMRTRLIDRIVAAIIREGVDFRVDMRKLSPEQLEFVKKMREGEFRSAHTTLHKSTYPDFMRIKNSTGWNTSLLLERMLLFWLLQPEGERLKLRERGPELDFVDPMAPDGIAVPETWEDSEIADPSNPDDPEAALPDMSPPAAPAPDYSLCAKGKTIVEGDGFLTSVEPGKEGRVKILFAQKEGFFDYLKTVAKDMGMTRTRLMDEALAAVTARGLVYMGGAEGLDSQQREVLKKLDSGRQLYIYIPLKRSTRDSFEQAQRLTLWERNTLFRRLLLTWLLAPADRRPKLPGQKN